MRIGLFTDTYFPATNGAVYMVETIRVNLEAMGHEVFVVAPKKGLRGPRREGGIIWMPSIGSMFYDDQLTAVFFPPKELRSIEKLDLDIIMFFTPGQVGLLGAYSALRLRIPLVSQYCTDVSEYISEYPNVLPGVIALALSAPFVLNLSMSEMAQASKRMILSRPQKATPSQRLVIKLMTELHNRCDAVVAVSDKMAHKLREWHTTSPVVVIPAGVDPLPVSISGAEDFRRQHGIAASDKVVMYVGRLAEEKNLDLLIDAFSVVNDQIPDAKLVFVGEYMYRPALERHAAGTQYSEKVIFTGRYPREELGSVYAAADVFAFPSMTDTQALVVNEAAHAGLPFVWIDSGLNDVLIDGKTGYRAGNTARSYGEKLVKLLQNERQREEFGRNSQAAALDRIERKQVRQLYELFVSLIGPKR